MFFLRILWCTVVKIFEATESFQHYHEIPPTLKVLISWHCQEQAEASMSCTLSQEPFVDRTVVAAGRCWVGGCGVRGVPKYSVKQWVCVWWQENPPRVYCTVSCLAMVLYQGTVSQCFLLLYCSDGFHSLFTHSPFMITNQLVSIDVIQLGGGTVAVVATLHTAVILQELTSTFSLLEYAVYS